jgi:protein-tyrosine phosphatase
MQQNTPHGPVYEHYDMGDGRGATFVAAFLLTTQRVQNIDEAIALLKRNTSVSTSKMRNASLSSRGCPSADTTPP